MNLARTQFLSLVTKGITTTLGIIQSIIVVRILSPAEFGLVGLVVSVGSVIGVSQHLGIVDGAIREIAVRKKKKEIGKVFWVSHLVRQVVTVPLSIGLILLAEPIAVGIYNKPEIIPYILIFAGALVLQGLQDVLGATLTGMKKFISLYTVQIITAAVNVVAFGFFTWKYAVAGFFWAVVVTTSIMVIMFAQVVYKNLRRDLQLPTWEEIKLYGRNVMRIGVFMYLSRIFFVIWQRLPLLMLGGVLAADELGYINVSLTFGSKLTIIAMALSEVNLSWMSSLYEHKRKEFVKNVTKNMHRILVMMLMMTLVLLFFAPEILRYIIGAEYLPAQPLILLVTLAFFLYALTDIGTSSIFVPANKPKLRAWIYGIMTIVSAALTTWILLFSPSAFLATQAIVAGSAIAYALMVIIAYRRFDIRMISGQLAVLLVTLALAIAWLYAQPALSWRIIVFLLLTLYAGYEAYRSKLWPASPPLRVNRTPGDSQSNLIQKSNVAPTMRSPRFSTSSKLATTRMTSIRVICFAGAEFDQPTWTNRQHIMSRVSKQYPVLYIEPRVWIFRYISRNISRPRKIFQYIKRLIAWEKVHDNLYIKSQWNLIPGSREYKAIAIFNHLLNRWNVLLAAKILGFRSISYKLKAKSLVLWFYDTEAAEYLSAFKGALVIYDCVDDHAAQAGVDRNTQRIEREEHEIMKRADLVTVTSKKLLQLKKQYNRNVHLVLNAGDVALYTPTAQPTTKLRDITHPILGTVGALDSYKIDFDLLYCVAKQKSSWQFVFIGSPIVERKSKKLERLMELNNVHVIGTVPRQEVPSYITHFDVCLIPYKNNRYNRSSFPLKFWEFMATGKPVIVSGVPELREYRDLIEYVTDYSEFIAAANHVMKHDVRGTNRRSLAGNHSWEHRVNLLLKLINKTIKLRTEVTPHSYES